MSGLDAVALLKGLPALDSGAHEAGTGKLCAMEMVAWLAGEAHTDHPACACPVLGGYVRSLNDRIGDERRQALLKIVPLLLDTKADEAAERRRVLMLRAAPARILLPHLMQALGQTEMAARLRRAQDIPALRLQAGFARSQVPRGWRFNAGRRAATVAESMLTIRVAKSVRLDLTWSLFGGLAADATIGFLDALDGGRAELGMRLVLDVVARVIQAGTPQQSPLAGADHVAARVAAWPAVAEAVSA